MYDKASLPKWHDFRHLLGCDTIGMGLATGIGMVQNYSR